MSESNPKIAIMINTSGDVPYIEFHSPNKEITSGEKRMTAELIQFLASSDAFPNLQEINS